MNGASLTQPPLPEIGPVADGADPARGGGRPRAIARFFTGPGLPVFVLTAVAVYEAFLAAVVFSPSTWGAWSAFATEFKVWCFDYDPRTGGMEWAAVVVMLIEPGFIAVITAFLWRQALVTLRTGRTRRAQAGAGVAGVIVALGVIAGLLAYGQPAAEAAPLPFPGERIRTRLAPPAFRLVDQQGVPFALDDVRGQVVLVTGVYALCSTSCPEILRETRALLEGLPGPLQERVVVAALSLNPEDDTRELISRVAAAYGFTYPQFRYLNEDPARMDDVLTRFGFARVRNPETGVIDHANLFVLIDAGGTIAYRFTLQPRHQEWLRAALVQLAAEASAVPLTAPPN